MSMHLRDIEVIVDKTIRKLTPEEVGELFANMWSEEQARFFNRVASVSAEWHTGGWVMQLQAIVDTKELTPEGRSVMETIGEYGKSR